MNELSHIAKKSLHKRASENDTQYNRTAIIIGNNKYNGRLTSKIPLSVMYGQTIICIVDSDGFAERNPRVNHVCVHGV